MSESLGKNSLDPSGDCADITITSPKYFENNVLFKKRFRTAHMKNFTQSTARNSQNAHWSFQNIRRSSWIALIKKNSNKIIYTSHTRRTCRLLLSSPSATRLEFNDFQFTRSAIARDPLTNCTENIHTHETELDSCENKTKNYRKAIRRTEKSHRRHSRF